MPALSAQDLRDRHRQARQLRRRHVLAGTRQQRRTVACGRPQPVALDPLGVRIRRTVFAHSGADALAMKGDGEVRVHAEVLAEQPARDEPDPLS